MSKTLEAIQQLVNDVRAALVDGKYDIRELVTTVEDGIALVKAAKSEGVTAESLVLEQFEREWKTRITDVNAKYVPDVLEAYIEDIAHAIIVKAIKKYIP